jgi:cellobiose dehydrogenase (acceptor)
MRPPWLDNTTLSRVDVPGLYKSIFTTQDDLTCSPELVNSFTGCTLGGNTAINAGLFFQPPDSDFDDYFPNGWKSQDMREAIAKVRSKQPFTDSPSRDGMRYLQSGYLAAREWLVGGAEYDEVRLNDVPNAKRGVFGHPEYNYEGGQRSGPVKTYLQSALKRPNFTLMTGVRVMRIARNGKVATGVDVINGMQTHLNILVNKGRVILSGGALFSPQLLMLSGIGPPESLSDLSSNSLLALPPSNWINNTAVGDLLFDNPNTFVELFSRNISSYVYEDDSTPAADHSLYLDHRSGPYSFASQTSAFWDYITVGNQKVGCQGTIDSSGAIDFADRNGTITLNIYGTSGMRSFGRVVLDEKGRPGPSGDFFYQNGADALAVGTFIYDIFQHLPPGLTPLNIDRNSTLSELMAWVSNNSSYTKQNVLHWSSSCRFGTCVDADTRVIGMNNLFVVDASVVPP